MEESFTPPEVANAAEAEAAAKAAAEAAAAETPPVEPTIKNPTAEAAATEVPVPTAEANPVTDESSAPEVDATDPLVVNLEPEVTQEVGPLTPEQQIKLENLDKYAGDTHKREEERENKRFRGAFGKAQRWMQTTKIGRNIKIGGKIVLGSAAMFGAGLLAGTPGLLAAPTLYSLGAKAVIDGTIEAGQYYLGKNSGNKRRLNIEGLKADLIKSAGAEKDRIWKEFDETEQTDTDLREYTEKINNLAKAIRSREEAIMDAQNADITREQKEASIRSVISSVGAISTGILTGVPLGIQDFDHNQVDHAVKLTTHGFGFIQTLTHTMHGLGAEHGVPLLGRIGVGAAVLALFAKTGWDLRKEANGRRIYEAGPDFIDFNPTQEEQEVQAEAETAEATAGTPNETTEAGATETTAEAPATTEASGETPVAAEAPVTTETSTETPNETNAGFTEFVNKEIRGGLPRLREELVTVNAKIAELDLEIKALASKERDRPGYIVQTIIDRYKAENNYNELSAKANELSNEIGKLKEAGDLVQRFDEIDEGLKTLDKEYEEIESKSSKSVTDTNRLEKIITEHDTLAIEKEKIRKQLLDIYNNLNNPTAEPINETPTEEANEESPEEVNFENAPEPEQTKRLDDLTNANEDGDYSDFLNDPSNYPDHLEIYDQKFWDKDAIHNHVDQTNKVIKQILAYFQAVQIQKAGGKDSKAEFVNMTDILSKHYNLLDPGGKINTKRVSEAFKWSLETYNSKSNKLEPKKIETMRNDLEAIIGQINATK